MVVILVVDDDLGAVACSRGRWPGRRTRRITIRRAHRVCDLNRTLGRSPARPAAHELRAETGWVCRWAVGQVLTSSIVAPGPHVVLGAFSTDLESGRLTPASRELTAS